MRTFAVQNALSSQRLCRAALSVKILILSYTRSIPPHGCHCDLPRDLQKYLGLGRASIVEGLGFGKGDNMVVFGMDNQCWFVPVSNLFQVSETLLFPETYCIEVQANELQQWPPKGKAALHNQPIDRSL